MTCDPILEAALEYTLKAEGGWANHKDDRGGPTNYGITLKVFQGQGKWADLDGDGDIDADDVKNMTKDMARDIYRRQYWVWDKLPASCDALVSRVDPRIKIKHFDTGVNVGVKMGTKLMQRAINATGGARIAEDGIMGPQTLTAALGVRADYLLANMCKVQLAYYEAIVRGRPSQATFMRGWTKRAKRIPPHP